MTKDINLSQTQRGKSTHKYDNVHRRHRHKNSRYHKCFQNYYHGYQYLKPNPVYIPHIKTSVNHWQLRDLLQYDSSLNLIYYTKSDSIYSYDLNNNIISNHCKLNYYPRCFSHANDGILVSGGLLNSSSKLFSMNIENLSIANPISPLSTTSSSPRKITKGLFSFHNSNLNISKSVRLGEMINNGVTIYPSSTNSYKSYVCNNDSYLYCMDIHNNDSIKIMNKFNLEINTCLNNVIQNPRSDKILTITGDSTSIFLVDPTSPNPNIKTIKSGHESGFGISYHNNGYLFSTVFQDGTCLLYDLRNISHNKPLIDIKSTRQGHQSGAFRVCKFSPQNDMNDLLIVSEHVGRVHLIDLRNLNYDNVDDHQVLVVPYALEQFAEFKDNVMGHHHHHLSHNNDESKDTETDYEDRRNLIDIYDNVKSRSSISRRKSSTSSYNSSPSDSPLKKKVSNSSSSNSPFSFPSPLVYDYDYLTNVNPKLFKDFIYVPPPPPLPLTHATTTSTKNWSDSMFNSTDGDVNSHDNDSVLQNAEETTGKTTERPSSYIDYEEEDDDDYDEDYDENDDDYEDYYGSRPDDYDEDDQDAYDRLYHNHHFMYPSSIPPQASTSMDSYANYSSINSTNNCDDSFQQSINHIHGEMELSGIEFCNSQYNRNSKILIGCQDAGIVMWDINNAARRSFGSFGYV